MEIEKLKKILYHQKNVSVQHLKQLSTKLTEESTNTSVVSDLPKLIPVVFKYAAHEDKNFREAALPALTELAGLLDLNKHLKEKPWWTEMKEEILKSVNVLMSLVSTGDNQWSTLWMTVVMMLGSDLRSELTLLNRLLKVVEKAFKMNDEEVRHQGFECWCKLIDNFSINKHEINNKRKLALLVIPLKANNHNTPRLCASKMKTWKHLLSKLDQHNEMTVETLVTHFLEFMFSGVGSIAPACKTLNTECANIFAQMLQTPLLFRILPKLFIKYSVVCIEHVHRDLPLCTTIWEGLLDNMKSSQWSDDHVSELMLHLYTASKSDKLGKSKTFAHMVRALYSGSHALPNDILVQHLRALLTMALEPHVLVNYTEEWCNELLNLVAETDYLQLPQNIVGDIIAKLDALAVSELFRDEKLKFLRGMWMTMTNIICKWMADDGQIGKNGNVDTDLQNIHQLLFFGAGPLSSTWNKLQMKSWKTLYSDCVKYFSLSTEVKCERFVSDLVELLLEGVKDKKIPLSVALDLVSIVLEFHLSKDESSILPLMLEVAASILNLFQSDTSGASAVLNQYLKIILVAARSEPTLVNDLLTVIDKMLTSLEEAPLISGHLEKTRNAILKVQIQVNALKPCRSQDRSESPSTSHVPPASSPTMTSFLHRLAKSKESKSKVGSPTPSQSSDVSSSPSHTPNSKKASSPFSDLKSEDFVFVPPKPRKILLTDHQKESLSTRKHDIPALYQDLSQDSSQSFDSIVTPVHATDKEDKTEKGTTTRSPQSFKEVNFKSLSPRKSLVSNLNSTTAEDKLQNNKENDYVSKNKKSPIKTNLQETKISEITEDAPFKILQEDQTRMQDNISDNVDFSKTLPANTRMRSRKSVTDSSYNKSLTNVKENTKTTSSSLGKLDASTKLVDQVTRNEVLSKDYKNIEQPNLDTNNKNIEKKAKDASLVDNVSTTKNSNSEVTTPTNHKNEEKKTKDTSLVNNISTPKNSGIEEVKTPKRSLRKNKLNISVEKSGKKNEQRNKQEQNGKGDLNLSSASITTPKVSPRRLRKRKSGLTPVLSGGEFIKKIRKSQSPTCSKDTPTNKSVTKNEASINANNNNLDGNDSPVLSEESGMTPKPLNENNDVDGKTNFGSVKDKSKSDFKITQNERNITRPSVISKEELSSRNIDDEIEVVAIFKIQDGNQFIPEIEDESKVGLKSVDSECKLDSSKSLKSFTNKIPCIDISCSPVKVVVERLPEIFEVVNPLNFEIQENVESSAESMKDINKKKVTPVRNITPSLTGNNQDVRSNDVEPRCEDQSVKSKAIVCDGKRKSTNPEDISADKLVDSKAIVCEGKRKSTRSEDISADKLVDSKAVVCEGKRKSTRSEDISADKLVDSKAIVCERKRKSINSGVVSDDKLVETCKQSKDNEFDKKCNNSNSNISKKDKAFENEKSITDNFSTEKVHSESSILSPLTRKTRSMDTLETNLIPEKCIKEATSSSFIEGEKTLLHEKEKQDESDAKSTPVKEICLESSKQTCVSPSKSTENSNSPSKLSKPRSSENTPVKSGQKQLRQTQLPFTPVRKMVASKSDLRSESESSQEHNISSKTENNDAKSPLLILVRMESPEINKALHSPKSINENKTNTVKESEPTPDSHKINSQSSNEENCVNKAVIEQSFSDNRPETRQEVQRTPEKANTSKNTAVCLRKTEVEVVQNSNTESPNKVTESEDIIASSQETNVSTQSILLSLRNSSSNGSLKLLSKSPKKSENPTQTILSSERVLRSSPSKVENSRFSGTPVKKSVCRRLDVEIEESPEASEVDGLPTDNEAKSISHHSSEELSNDFKFLNGDSGANKNMENLKESETANKTEDTQSMDLECSPRSHKNLKRFVVETDASSVGSPKRTMGSLRLESSSSPISSPNSRTSQMMELAKQETERTISSPIGSAKRRRILPVRVGPVTRTPKSHIIQRTHTGPSEEWVRRTYSPTASPNSSILKRTHALPISPDSSPPSSKKKRVSFLDPPVSESLLFSKANPGKGQIQRPELLQDAESACLDTESEDLDTSQGLVGVELAETSNPEVKVFSPLKQCVNPLTDILERVVSLQWISELQAQLERLGVTTVGQLSSLPEETVQRLPFIPPKLERLRKILQNYYNEINEKPDDTRVICSDANLSSGKVSSEVLVKSPEKITDTSKSEVLVKSPEKTSEDSKPESNKTNSMEPSDEDISTVAEDIKNKIQRCPELISELGNTLHIDIIMKLLDFAVCKLKTEKDES